MNYVAVWLLPCILCTQDTNQKYTGTKLAFHREVDLPNRILLSEVFFGCVCAGMILLWNQSIRSF